MSHYSEACSQSIWTTFSCASAHQKQINALSCPISTVSGPSFAGTAERHEAHERVSYCSEIYEQPDRPVPCLISIMG